MRVHAALLLGFAAACSGRPLASVGETDATNADLPGTTGGDAATSMVTESSDTTSGVEPTTASADSTGAVIDSTGSSAPTESSSDTATTTTSGDETHAATTASIDSTGVVVEGTATSESSTGVSTSTDADTTTTDIEGSAGSSSTSGVAYPTCFGEAWTVAIPEVDVLAPAVVIDGPIFVAGNTPNDEGWVGAWDQDGNESWSKTIDPAELGLDDAAGEVVDIDALVDGDALLSYSHSGDDRSAVFVRLDGATGETVWTTALGGDELAEFDPEFDVDGEAFAAAVTGSGRVLVVGGASLALSGLV